MMSGKSILVIEDAPAVRDKILTALDFEGFDAMGAPDGLEGVELAQQHKPDLIICDVMMPRLDGYGTLAELQKNPETAAIPFIFLTAKADRGNMRQGMDLGADDYLTKPFTVPELISAVNARLGRREMLAQRYAEQLQHAEQTLQRISRVSRVTGLPNRECFEDDLAAALATSRDKGAGLAVLLVDVDGVKLVNEAWGHKIGDHLLKAVAERTTDAVSATGGTNLSHLGGGEFGLIMAGNQLRPQIEQVAESLFEDLSGAFQVEGHEIFLTANLGVAFAPEDGDEALALLKNADTAVHWARDLAPNRYQVFTEDMSTAAIERLLGQSALRRALEDDELEVRFRPRRNLKTGRISSLDAVPYWSHPELGLVAPERFMGLAEEAGVADQITSWILRTACEQNAAWQKAGYPSVRVTVRIDGQQFLDPGLADKVESALRETGVKPETLELLVNEEAITSNLEESSKKLTRIKSRGVELCVDDFSIQERSLKMVKELPVDRLILKRSLIMHVADDLEDRAIVTAVISLAHSLGLKVVAEGVETDEQFKILRLRQCDEVQGYASGAPMSSWKAEKMLASRARL